MDLATGVCKAVGKWSGPGVALVSLRVSASVRKGTAYEDNSQIEDEIKIVLESNATKITVHSLS